MPSLLKWSIMPVRWYELVWFSVASLVVKSLYHLKMCRSLANNSKIRNFGQLLYDYLCIWWKLYQYGLIQMTQIADKHFALLIEDLWQAENSLSAHWWLRVNLLCTDQSSINWSRESSNQTFAFSFFCFVRTYVHFRYFF